MGDKELPPEVAEALRRALERERAHPQEERVTADPDAAKKFGIDAPLKDKQRSDERENPSK